MVAHEQFITSIYMRIKITAIYIFILMFIFMDVANKFFGLIFSYGKYEKLNEINSI